MKSKSLLKAAATAATLMLAGQSHATVWNIDSVLSGTDGGYGYSGFHDASGHIMSGSDFGTIVNVLSGTYNDVTGAFNATFEVDPIGSGSNTTFTLDGSLLFSADFLADGSTLDIDFVNTDSNLIDTTLGFAPGDVCCNGNNNGIVGLDPNSFDASSGVMTLWGANGFDDGVTSGNVFDYYSGSTLGMDLRVQMSAMPVPEPSTLTLLALSATAFGLARRRPAKPAQA